MGGGMRWLKSGRVPASISSMMCVYCGVGGQTW